MQLNASRIKVLQAQDDVVNAMKDSANKELLRASDDKNAYKKLLKGLIVQVATLNLSGSISCMNLYIYWHIHKGVILRFVLYYVLTVKPA